MAIAPILEEDPEFHVEELHALKSDSAYSRIRIRDLAEYYQNPKEWYLRSPRENNQLLFAFKAAAMRFSIFDDPVVNRAIRALADPTGW